MAGVYRIYHKKKKFLLGNLNTNLILIFINVICFILFSFLISFKVFTLDFVAINPLNIFQGQYLWTFITSMFMHGSFFHLFVNMLSLFFIGSLTEKILGARRYLSFYLISGLFAGLFFVLSGFFSASNLSAYAVGASGALFGLIGILMCLTPNLPVYVMFIPIPIKMKYAAPGLLVVLWFISIAGDMRIGNVAHFGGLVVGLVYGIYL